MSEYTHERLERAIRTRVIQAYRHGVYAGVVIGVGIGIVLVGIIAGLSSKRTTLCSHAISIGRQGAIQEACELIYDPITNEYHYDDKLTGKEIKL